VCVIFQFLVYCSGVFFQEGKSAQGAMLVYNRGSWGEYRMMLCAHLFGLPNVSQAGLELVAYSSGIPPVFSV
jgi:hypothetical protein